MDVEGAVVSIDLFVTCSRGIGVVGGINEGIKGGAVDGGYRECSGVLVSIVIVTE